VFPQSRPRKFVARLQWGEGCWELELHWLDRIARSFSEQAVLSFNSFCEEQAPMRWIYTAPTVRWRAPRIEVQKSSEVAGFISLISTAKRRGYVLTSLSISSILLPWHSQYISLNFDCDYKLPSSPLGNCYNQPPAEKERLVSVTLRPNHSRLPSFALRIIRGATDHAAT
jgi:hypothetical protein